MLAKLAYVSKNEAFQNKKIHYHCNILENAPKNGRIEMQMLMKERKLIKFLIIFAL